MAVSRSPLQRALLIKYLVLWAQRSHATDNHRNVVYLRVNLPGIEEQTLKYDLTETGLRFECVAKFHEQDERAYQFEVDFYDKVVPSESAKKLNSRGFSMTIRKGKAQTQYWPRLTKDNFKIPFIRVDFEKVSPLHDPSRFTKRPHLS